MARLNIAAFFDANLFLLFLSADKEAGLLSFFFFCEVPILPVGFFLQGLSSFFPRSVLSDVA